MDVVKRVAKHSLHIMNNHKKNKKKIKPKKKTEDKEREKKEEGDL